VNLAALFSDNRRLKEEIELLFSDSLTLIDYTENPDSLLQLGGQTINLAFLDVPLKGRDAFELLRWLRKRMPNLPVIVFLPESAPRLSGEALEYGAYDIMVKPVDNTRLRISVAHALEKDSLVRERHYLKERIFNFKLSERRLEPPSVGQRNNFYSEAMRRFSEVLLKFFEGKEFINALVRTMGEIFGSTRTALFLFQDGKYRVCASSGWDEAWTKKVSFLTGEGLAGWLEKKLQIINLEQDPILSGQDGRVRQEMELACARVCVPIFFQGRMNGFLTLGNRISGRKFSSEDIDFLSLLASYLGLIIENFSLYHQAFLKKKEQEMVLQNLAAGVVAVNPEGIITTFNQKAGEILGFSSERPVGKKIGIVGSQLADLVWRALKNHQLVHSERIVYPLNKKPLGVSTSLIQDEEGQPAGAVLIFTDLTTLEELERKVSYLEKLKFWYQLASSMAHQIKNPLVAIKTFIQLFPEKYQDREFHDNFYKIALEEVERLNRIVSDLFEFAEPAEINPTLVPLNELIESTLHNFLEKTGRKVEVTKELKANLTVSVDRQKMEKAFTCILINAGEAMKHNPKLHIQTEMVEEAGSPYVRIDFQDNGGGIPPEKLSEIFSPFYTTKTKGMGLGLPIAQRIIEDHKGKIRVESTPRKGTVCRVFLPLK